MRPTASSALDGTRGECHVAGISGRRTEPRSFYGRQRMRQDCPARPDAACREWPLQSGLPLGPIPTAASCARVHARLVMCEWGMGDVAESVELVVSELLTNAVTASRELEGGPYPVRFWLLSDRMRVLVLVWDPSPEPPVRLEPAGDAEGGRGLMVVEALSTSWDWYAAPLDRIEGKAVWALITME